MAEQANEPAPAFKFETIEPGKYRLPLVSDSGRSFALLVKKESVPNPSARGGAYRDRWVAYNGGLYVKESGETRIEAVRKALAALAKRNIVLTQPTTD